MAAGLLGWEQGTPQEEGKQLGRQSMVGLLIRRALHGDMGTQGHGSLGLLQGLENQECGPGLPGSPG